MNCAVLFFGSGVAIIVGIVSLTPSMVSAGFVLGVVALSVQMEKDPK